MSKPMTPERIAEIRARSRRHPIHAEADMPEVLAEVERLRAVEQRVREVRASWKQGAVRARRLRDQADQNRDVANMLRENAWMTAYTELGKEIDAALDGTEAGR